MCTVHQDKAEVGSCGKGLEDMVAGAGFDPRPLGYEDNRPPLAVTALTNPAILPISVAMRSATVPNLRPAEFALLVILAHFVYVGGARVVWQG